MNNPAYMERPLLAADFEPGALLGYIRRDFPDFAINGTPEVIQGYDNVVLVVNGNYIFRFPKREEVRFSFEVNILRILRDRISIKIPLVDRIGKSARYMGYPRLEGDPLEVEIVRSMNNDQVAEIASQLALFLFEIHTALASSEIQAFGIEPIDPDAERQAVVGLLPQVHNAEFREFISRTLREYELIIHAPGEFRVLFNDLHAGNIAFNREKGVIEGIYDFSDLKTGDVHIDFRDFCPYGDTFLEAAVREYAHLFDERLNLRTILIYHRINVLANWSRDFEQLQEETEQALESWLADPDKYR